jgi:4-amino-4-deoxy-L-arabinose transferase-like glycosyltransferase
MRPPDRRAAALLSGCAVALALLAFWAEGRSSLRPWPVLALWLASIALLLGAARLLGSGRTPRSSRISRAETALVLLLTGAALVARTIALSHVPGNFGGDEGEMGTFARSVIGGELRDPFTTGWFSHPTLWFFLQAGSLRVFGDTIFGLRMLSALIGTATVPALYLFARRACGRRVAVLAAALLALYHFHVHFSRIGMNNVADPLFGLLAFTALLRAYETRSPFHFALGGVLLGVSQHFYLGTRLLPIVFAALVLHQLVVARAKVRSTRGGLALTLLGFAVGFGPGLRVPLLHWSDYTARLAIPGAFAGSVPLHSFVGQARRSFGAFTFTPDAGPFYQPGMPLLDPVSSFFFVAGVALLVLRWQRPESALLLAWLIGTCVFGGILLSSPPQSQRYVTTAPVICLVIAIALERAAAVLRTIPWAPRLLAPASAAAAVLGLGLWNLGFYFRDYSPRNSYGYRATEAATAIAHYLQPRLRRGYVYFFGPPRIYLGHGTIKFVATGLHGTDVLRPIVSAGDLPPGEPPGLRPIFLFLPERAVELSAIRARYPRGRVETVRAGSDHGVLFYAYRP